MPTTNNKFTYIDPRQITHSDDFSHRKDGQNETHVAALGKTLRATGRLDPVLLWQEITGKGEVTGRLILLDGLHRLAAYDANAHAKALDGS